MPSFLRRVLGRMKKARRAVHRWHAVVVDEFELIAS
jgi:hypothetical protein